MKTTEDKQIVTGDPSKRVDTKTIKKTKKKKKKKDNFEVRIPRIIVRNLNFKVSEDLLKKTFEANVGAIKTVSLVTRDGNPKGFGFVTFEKLDDAQKAIQTMNGRKILGRPMAVDWSLPKNVYQRMQTQAPRAEPSRNDSYGIQSDSNPVKQQEESVHEDQSIHEDDDDDEVEEEEETPVKTDASSRDVREQRTVFVRNVPFDATEDELVDLFSSDGQRRVNFCRLVIDRISRHPKGSAFVQFGSTADAEDCLNASFSLRGFVLQLDMALGRGDLVKATEIREQDSQQEKKHDQRNLALAKCGVILNLAELDGNEADLRKRQNLEDVKKQKLKDPMHFVSRTRLTLHNLPPSVDDKQLRKLVIDALTSETVPARDIVLTECRVMKSTKDARKSLGFGFVNLSRHDLALRVIELLNNNRDIFGANRRPIIQFAIENRRALQLKEQRQERLQSKQELFKNPANQTLAFEGDSNRKRRRLFNSTSEELDTKKPKTRLSEIFKQQQRSVSDSQDQNALEIDEHENLNTTSTDEKSKKIKRKRPKTKSKREIRDNVDQMIAASRKSKLPERTKQKWFE